MSNLRKNLHLAYKEKMVEVILSFMDDVSKDEVCEKLINYDDFRKYTINWVNANSLPMGDFDKDQAIKEIEEWSE